MMLKEGQRLTGTGLLATMGPGLSYAIAAALAYPGRQSVAIEPPAMPGKLQA
jgi:pyruvate dehydrogenase (quinone)